MYLYHTTLYGWKDIWDFILLRAGRKNACLVNPRMADAQGIARRPLDSSTANPTVTALFRSIQDAIPMTGVSSVAKNLQELPRGLAEIGRAHV